MRLAPAEQTKRAPTIDQACLDRLSAAGTEFEQVTLPPAVNPECAIATPVRLKAVKLPPRWRASIRLPEEPTLSCQFGERFGHWLRDLVAPLIAGELAVELKSVHTGQIARLFCERCGTPLFAKNEIYLPDDAMRQPL